MNFNNFSCLIFDPKMCKYLQAQKNPRGKMCQYPEIVYCLSLCSFLGNFISMTKCLYNFNLGLFGD